MKIFTEDLIKFCFNIFLLFIIANKIKIYLLIIFIDGRYKYLKIISVNEN